MRRDLGVLAPQQLNLIPVRLDGGVAPPSRQRFSKSNVLLQRRFSSILSSSMLRMCVIAVFTGYCGHLFGHLYTRVMKYV
jgi:hypothetical protein